MGAITPAGKFAAPPMTGLETQGLHLPAPGGEMAALSGAHGAMMPGAEQISPLINMIMKMPGHIGLVSSFFEALGSFFAPAQEMLGHLAAGLDPSALFEHAGAASESLGGMLESVGEHMSVDLNLLPADAPIFDQIGHGATAGDFGSGGLESSGQAMGAGAPHLSDSFASAPRLEVGGSPSHPLFEQGLDAKPLNFAPSHDYLAMEPNRGFGATVGSFNPPTAAAPQVMPQPTVHPVSHAAAPVAHTAAPAAHIAPQAASHSSSALDFRKDALSSSREHLLGNTADGAAHGAAPHDAASHVTASHEAASHASDAHTSHANQPAVHQQEIHQVDKQGASGGDRIAEVQSDGKIGNEGYTVHKGDNLWDIAKSHLGDGSRWEEIYDLNKSVLGDNPRMIMPGTELQLPGGDAIASGTTGGADYTVQSGDSLSSIAHDHLGGSQNWHDLYQNNEAVIGSNPAMIHPGQHLQLDASAHGHSLVAGSDAGAGGAPAGHAGADHSAASGASHSHHLASHPHGPVHSHNATPAHPSHPANADHNVAQASLTHHTTAASSELKAQARSLSSIQSYGDGATHTIDSSSQVPNQQP
jgi:nucleoid-associated protein YgaU